MELVYCFSGMAIFCCILEMIFAVAGSFFGYRNKMDKVEKSFSLVRSFQDCTFYFLILETVALFFA